jgi:hypothetical protein
MTQFPEWFGSFERATYVMQVRLGALSPVFSSTLLYTTTDERHALLLQQIETANFIKMFYDLLKL